MGGKFMVARFSIFSPLCANYTFVNKDPDLHNLASSG